MIVLQDIQRAYFVGIGGIGMSALARYLQRMGIVVAGYDKTESALTRQLVTEGIPVIYTDDFSAIPSEFVQEDTLVVYTPAVPADTEVLTQFRESGNNIIKRAALLGVISQSIPTIAIAGTHGKTTTTAILAHILETAGVAHTSIVGGILTGYNTNLIGTGTEVLVTEADEYDRSFLQLHPDAVGVTSISPDHLDIYDNEEDFKASFVEFASKVEPSNRVLAAGVSLEGQTIGFEPNDDVFISHLQVVDGAYHFGLVASEYHAPELVLHLPGHHNLMNAAMASALAMQFGVGADYVRAALENFRGIDRRFTYRAREEDYVIIDDYAHHPDEIDAVHQAITEFFPGQKSVVVFQPHLYTRTRDFMEGFARSLAAFDEVYLLDIYPARELSIEGVTSQVLARRIAEVRQMQEHEIDKPAPRVIEKHHVSRVIYRSDAPVRLLLGAGDIGVIAATLEGGVYGT